MESINPDSKLVHKMAKMSKKELNIMLKECRKIIKETIIEDNKKQKKLEEQSYFLAELFL